MKRASKIVDGVNIASPCHMSWDRMSGDDRVRFCESCKLHVFNISEMDVEEAANLISKTDGRLCIRLYRRRDGTVITRDCPVGAKAKMRRAFAVAASTCILLLTGAFWAVASLFGSLRGRSEMGDVTMGTPMPVERVEVMGQRALPAQPAPVEQGEMVLGRPVTGMVVTKQK